MPCAPESRSSAESTPPLSPRGSEAKGGEMCPEGAAAAEVSDVVTPAGSTIEKNMIICNLIIN